MSLQQDLEWYAATKEGPQAFAEEAKIDFAMALSRAIEDRGMLRRDLAEAFGSSPAYITKVLRGDANLTIETMVKLAYHAGGRLHLHISPRHAAVR